MKKSGTNANQNSDIKNMVKDAILELGLPTKKDILGLPTKKDILGLPTKKDILGLPTKKDILDLDLPSKKDMKDFSSKTDITSLSRKIDNVTRILVENEDNLKELGTLKTRLDTLDKIMVSVDKIAGDILSYQQEQALNSNSLSEHTDTLEKHETRIDTLEKHVRISPAL
jgi:hypothetical protein